jgi:hypothetical protein
MKGRSRLGKSVKSNQIALTGLRLAPLWPAQALLHRG